MDIFGLDPIIAAVLFTVTGAGLQLALGYLSNKDPFDGRKALSTALTTVVIGIVAVSTTLGAIAEDATDLNKLIVVATIIAGVAGFDTLKNNVIKAAQNRTK